MCRRHWQLPQRTFPWEQGLPLSDRWSRIRRFAGRRKKTVESVSFSMPFLDFSLPCCKQQAFCYTNVPSVSTAVGAPGLECNKKISALFFSSPLLLLIFVSAMRVFLQDSYFSGTGHDLQGWFFSYYVQLSHLIVIRFAGLIRSALIWCYMLLRTD